MAACLCLSETGINKRWYISKTTGKNKNKNKVTYNMIDSDYGHDAFLVEVDKFKDQIMGILEEKIMIILLIIK